MSYTPSFPERTDRLNNFTQALDISQDFPLLKSAHIAPELVEQLTLATKMFLIDSLQCHFNKTYRLDTDILKTYRDDILQLPNITPNGLFLAKKPTNLSFNAVHHAAANILDSLNIEPQIDRIHLPISLRLVNGASDPALNQRPRASTKVHLDIWAGEPTHAYMVFVPLLGDVARNGVAFYEAPDMPAEWLKPLADYAEGAHLQSTATQYDAEFRTGEIFFVDPFLLHNTLKQSPELRLSLEFRVLPKQQVSSDLPPPQERMRNYIDYATWREMGQSKLCISDAPLSEYKDADKVRNEYASDFRIVNLENG